MFRFAGCFLIFLSCTALGMLKASSYRMHTAELQNTLELIRLLDMEITYKRDSLAKTFEKVSEMKQCWFSHVLKSCSVMLRKQNTLESSWQYALDEHAAVCPLYKKEIEILRDFSIGLGKSDIKGQRNLIEPAILRLEECITEAKRQEQKQGKMYRGLGIAGGIAIAVIII